VPSAEIPGDGLELLVVCVGTPIDDTGSTHGPVAGRTNSRTGGPGHRGRGRVRHPEHPAGRVGGAPRGPARGGARASLRRPGVPASVTHRGGPANVASDPWTTGRSPPSHGHHARRSRYAYASRLFDCPAGQPVMPATRSCRVAGVHAMRGPVEQTQGDPDRLSGG
jgi:hypothetical protein